MSDERYIIESYERPEAFGAFGHRAKTYWRLKDTATDEIILEGYPQAYSLSDYAKILNHIEDAYGSRINLLWNKGSNE